MDQIQSGYDVWQEPKIEWKVPTIATLRLWIQVVSDKKAKLSLLVIWAGSLILRERDHKVGQK